MPDFTIRPAVSSDCAAVSAVAESAYGHYVARMGKKPAPMTEDYARRIAAGQVHVLQAGDGRGADVLGFVVLETEPGCLLLDNVAVSPKAQGRGYGKALMRFAEEKAAALGVKRVRLYTNEVMVENLLLYAHLGFVETHRASEQGYNRIFMAKQLP